MPSLDKLASAVSALEEAVDERLDREAALTGAEAEVQRMGADRARLAESLDNAEARAQQLESANREVSRRLVDAMESIRSVLERTAVSHEGKQLSATLSAGCASLECVTAPTAQELIALADARLYEAKNRGRNQVVIDPV